MTKQDIKNLFEHFSNEDIEYVTSIISDEKLSSEIKELMQKEQESDEMIELLYDGFHDIIEQIREAGLYDDFENIGLKDDNKNMFFTIIARENLTRKQAEKYISYAGPSEKVDILKAANDSELIKQYIDDENISSYEKIQLIIATNDIEYIKEQVTKPEFEYRAWELVKATGDKEYIKQYLSKHAQDIPNDIATELITSINDSNFILECVKDESINLSLSVRLEVLKSLNDANLIKEIVKNKNSNLLEHEKCQLIKQVGNVDFIKECINTELGFSNETKLELVKATRDKEYIKQYLIDGDDNLHQQAKIDLIETIGDKEFLKECVKGNHVQLDNNHISYLIIQTFDKEYIKQCFNDETFNFNIKEKADLLIATCDEKFIEKNVKEWLNDDKVTLSEDEKTSLIVGTKNDEFIKVCIETMTFNSKNIVKLLKTLGDREYKEKLIAEDRLDIHGKEKVEIVKLIGDSKYIKKCITEKKLNLSEFEESALMVETQEKEEIKDYFKVSDEKNREIKLPEGITIGVEIEADGFKLERDFFDDWKSKRDGSIPEGLEVVSPILTGTKEDTDNIYTICNMLNKLNCDANEKCGGHVHIGASFLSSKQSYSNLLEIWGNTEKILYTISNKQGELTRYGGVTHYAMPISKKIETAMENGTVNLDDETELDKFAMQLRNMQGNRYSGINFLNLSDTRKSTIEFRLANGTIDPNTWVENINLFGGIIVASEKLYQIQQKEQTERTEEEKSFIENFEKLKYTQDDREKLGMLLDLTIDEKDRDIYIDRYNANSKIMKDNIETEKAIDEQVSIKPIVLKDKESKVLSSAIEATEEIVTNSNINEQVRHISNIERETQELEEIT